LYHHRRPESDGANQPKKTVAVARALLERPQRLPEFYLVSLRIIDPSETAVVVVFAFRIDPDTFRRELREESVEVGDAKVDHERRRARVEILRHLNA